MRKSLLIAALGIVLILVTGTVLLSPFGASAAAEEAAALQPTPVSSVGASSTTVVCYDEATIDPKDRINFCAKSWCVMMDLKCTLTAQVGNCCYYQDCVETACQATLCPNQPPMNCCG